MTTIEELKQEIKSRERENEGLSHWNLKWSLEGIRELKAELKGRIEQHQADLEEQYNFLKDLGKMNVLHLYRRLSKKEKELKALLKQETEKNGKPKTRRNLQGC